MLVRDTMTRAVITVAPGTSVLNARRLLAEHDIRHLPVVVGDEVVGMVSDRDVRINDVQLGQLLAGLQSDLISGRYRRVATLMSSPPIVIGPLDSVATAAETMTCRRISALPVVEHGKLVGIIGLTDCVRALVRAEQQRTTPAPHEIDAVITMPPGDARPGRPARRPVAVVVDADATGRLLARNDLTAAGYRVVTCPGPHAGIRCDAAGRTPTRCPRVPADASLVLIADPHAADTDSLVASYARWLPDATIRVGPSVTVPA